jgi:hypothetical protein
MRITKGEIQVKLHGWEQPITGQARRLARAVARYKYLAVAAVVLAVSMTVALLPHGVSGAAATGLSAAPSASPSAGPNDDGVTWDPDGTLVQENDGNVCDISGGGTVTAPGPGVITSLAGALGYVPSLPVNKDGITSESVDSIQVSASGTSLTVQGEDAVSCSLVNQVDAYFKKAGHGSLGQAVQATVDAYRSPAPAPGPRTVAVPLAFAGLPVWLRGAIAAIASVMVYILVSEVTVAAMIAFGAATGPAAAIASPALAAFAGCIAGAISIPLATAIAGNDDSTLTGVAQVAAGCFFGSAAGVLRSAIPWLSQVYGEVFGEAISAGTAHGIVSIDTAAEIWGPEIVDDAAAAQVDIPVIELDYSGREILSQP